MNAPVSSAATPPTFWGHDSTYWAGVEAIAVCFYTIFVVITLLLIYGQLRIAASTFRLQAIRNIQEVVAAGQGDRKRLIELIPLDLVVTAEQYPEPPARRRTQNIDPDEQVRVSLTEKQKQLLSSLDDDTRLLARNVIGRFNDIGELIEDATVDKRTFLGKYHAMVIRICHLVEAIRRDEEAAGGANYGQRLLRMRHWAITYNDISPYHRNNPVYLTRGDDWRLLYHSPRATIRRRLEWGIRRLFHWY